MQGHTPYGYRITNGKAIVDDAAADRVRALFQYYLSGLSLSDAGKESGVNRPHSSLGLMLSNVRYLGDGFYPPIVDGEVFDRAQAERVRRLEIHGRAGEPMKKERRVPRFRFHAPEITQAYDDPFEQAEYAYNQITCEVVDHGR
jgi:hypothetical protein